MNYLDLRRKTIGGLSNAIKEGKISPVEVTESYLGLIEDVDDTLNCYITVTADLARRQAALAEKEIRQGRYRGSLHGIPIAVKDNIATKGIRTTNGSRLFWDYVPDHDATVVERLGAAGAILLGKLNLHEFAVAPNAKVFGACKNPWNLEHSPGGSSSGSAAAVAASLCAASLGTDTGGSIRIPSSYCGVTGLKPSNARVSRFGVTTLSWTLDTVGPIAKTVEDCAILLQTISGRDERDSPSSDSVVPTYLQSISNILPSFFKIAVPDSYFFDICDKQVERSVRAAISSLERAGCQISEVAIPWMKYAKPISDTIMLAEAAHLHHQTLKQKYESYGPAGQRIASGFAIPATKYITALRARDVFRRKFGDLLRDFDAMIVPTIENVAPRISDWSGSVYFEKKISLTALFNIIGCPALSVLCGFSSDGLPIGMQIIGKAFGESTIFKLGALYEKVRQFQPRIPEISAA
jgi:aspartyl-tRNA(Asn)/glutamyl-tRNA(Gln) amidotransferase subunit A